MATSNPSSSGDSSVGRILGGWSDGATDPGLLRQELLHHLFEAQADAHPNSIALACGTARLTYNELEQAANQLARHLRSLGAGSGPFVALLLPRSMEVHLTLLAILKSGAAYVPLDAEYPADRVGFILGDCQVHTLVTTSALAAKAEGFQGNLVLLDTQWTAIASQSAQRLEPTEIQTSSDDLAYVIYTSGSTGRPKGVMIEHRSVCNLVRAEGRIFQVHPSDRVYQGFSIAFDASVEEVWLAFFAGATLVVGTAEMVHAGPALSRMLTDAQVTVLSCVPTLLSMMDDDVPTVRILILGGEACPQDLVNRWCRPGRRMVNTYGPTEATVIATYTECDPKKPITIGRPVPNYSTCILDSEMRPVPAGEAGELHIGGIGLARGYVGRPDLTAEKFVTNPYARDGSPASRLYKTGDLVRFNAQGEIEFLGRIDTQVKIRGFRVELAEIESVLMQCPGVQSAVVTVREDTPGLQQLVGYVIAREPAGSLDEDSLRVALRARLPVYMVPALIETVAGFPTLPSGKVDRKQLPPPRPRAAQEQRAVVEPRTELERKLVALWEKLFAPTPVSVHDDFFLELGGHSLLAARMVSELRKDAQLHGVSMLDVYNHPTIGKLAAKLEQDCAAARASAGIPKAKDGPAPRVASNSSHFLCGAAQFVSLYFALGFFALQWLAPYLTYTWLIEDDYEIYEAILGALGILVGLYPCMLLFSVAAKWALIGRYKAGNYPLWGLFYFRWWLANTIQSSVPVGYLAGTPLLNIYFRLLGARIGTNVHLGTDSFSSFDLLTIGDDTSVNVDAAVLGSTVEDGWLKIGPVNIGSRCFVGTRSVVREHTTMHDGARLGDLSMLPRGSIVPPGETWLGSPAQRVEKPAAPVGEVRRPSRTRRTGYGLLHAVGMLVFPTLVILAIFPGMMLMNYLNYEDDYYWYLTIAPLVAVSFVALLCLEIAAIKWLLLGRVKPGRYPLNSFFYVRKWFVDQTMDLSLDVVGPLYSSIYLAPWYRLLGAKLGTRAEISTASFISPDLLALDDESFIADSVSLGAARVENGWMTIGHTRVGKRSFIGNSAMLPPGTVIGDNCLIGCLSAPPPNPADAARADTTWMGSPAIFLPQRQVSTAFSVETTFNPTAKLQAQRALIEFVRVILPSTFFIILTSVMLSVVVLIQEDTSLHEMLLLFPLLYAGCGLAAVAVVVIAKWLLVGRYRPGERPLWSTFVWRNELLIALHENLANLFLVDMLAGTPFLCWFFRLLGAKIGRRVFMETTDLTEFDLVTIGDDAALLTDCTVQTHLFEDRVMKMSTIEIGARCTVGCLSVVLYDTKMEDDSALGDLSLLMKGESLPAGTRWEGIPARPELAPATHANAR